ncbi:MAG: amidohydrolase family protein [Oscillospiraceae bacterium]|nr:amidohydrolase family protein [Oscillospiraceae bacterium]
MERLKKIDMHVHSTPERFIERINGGTYATPDELRVIYDKFGIEKGLLLPSGMYAASTYDVISPREAYHLVQNYPETLGWWFCNVNPAWGDNTAAFDLNHFLNFFKSKGAKGLGELTENRFFDDPFMRNLFRHCEKCDMPITFHIGDMSGDYGIVDSLGLPGLEKTLSDFPELMLIGHSQKFWAEISGDADEKTRSGYPKGKVAKGGRVPYLLKKYPNMYADLSAGSGYNAVTRDPEFGYEFLEEFQNKLFYGTDICDPRNITNPMLQLAEYLDTAMENKKITYTAYEKISRKNALELLNR